MKLELDLYFIQDVTFGNHTSIKDHRLIICRDELTSLLMADPKLGQVEIELVHPGENARIIHIQDIIEPRIKAEGPGGVFPGIIGRVETVGKGQTLCLKGVGVINTGVLPLSHKGYNVLDMSGPGARLSPYYSLLHNVVIVPIQPPDVDDIDWTEAIIHAGLKASEYLAKHAIGSTSDKYEIYEMKPLSETISSASGLPRVAYLYQIYSHSDMRDTLYYGEKLRRMIPTLIHPNEVFDGAIVTGNYDMISGMKYETIAIQNHPIIKELYKRHGKEIWFVGVVIANEHPKINDKEKSAVLAAKMIKYVLGADAVIISQTGGGHPNIDLMLNCQMCERQGVRTVIIVSEESNVEGTQFPLVLCVPEADAIISTGNINEIVELPAVERVVGGDKSRGLTVSPSEALRIQYNMIPGSTSQIGGLGSTTALF